MFASKGETRVARGDAACSVVRVDELTEQAGGRQACGAAEVDGRLGVAAAHAHAALRVPQWVHVAWARKVARPRAQRRVCEHARGECAVVRGDAGRGAVAVVGRDRVRRFVFLLVFWDHERKLELLEALGRERDAHKAAVSAGKLRATYLE